MENEKESLIDKITSIATSRLKVPIISTYLIVLTLYNWDILYYLIYQKDTAICKINYIKMHYADMYYARIFECLGIAIIILIVFTSLNTLLNYLLKWFYKKDKAVKGEIDNFEKVDELTAQLASAFDEIKKLKEGNSNLNKVNRGLFNKEIINNDLTPQNIAKKELQSLKSSFNESEARDKINFSFDEFVKIIKENNKITLEKLKKTVTYEEEIQTIISILRNKKLIKINNFDSFSDSLKTFEISRSFEEILKLL